MNPVRSTGEKMKRLAVTGIILLGMMLACAPASLLQPPVMLATAAPSSTSTSVALIPPRPSASWTPTPTRVIVPVEQTPGTAAKTPQAIWGGVMASNTSRQYISNGKTVNTCNTAWTTALTFAIDSAGRVAGFGEGNLVSSQCSPHSVSGNTTNMKFRLDGTRDDQNLNLHVNTFTVTPQISGEFGAYNLLFNSMTCPANPRTMVLPLTGPTSAKASLKFNGIMTGCAGSKDDIVNSDNTVEVQFFADCDKRPADLQNPDVDALCH